MDPDSKSAFEWPDLLILLLFFGLLFTGGWTLYLRSRAHGLMNKRIPREKRNLQKIKELVTRIQTVQSGSSGQVENQRETLKSLETVLTDYLQEAGYPNAMKAINPTLLRSRKVEGTPYRRGGVRFTIEDLPLPYLARTLHMVEKRLPVLNSLNIQLTRLSPNKDGPVVIKKGSVTLVYFLPANSQ